MSYDKARVQIIEYLAKRYDDSRLSNEEYEVAVQIIDQIINDGKTSPRTPLMTKAKRAREQYEKGRPAANSA